MIYDVKMIGLILACVLWDMAWMITTEMMSDDELRFDELKIPLYHPFKVFLEKKNYNILKDLINFFSYFSTSLNKNFIILQSLALRHHFFFFSIFRFKMRNILIILVDLNISDFDKHGFYFRISYLFILNYKAPPLKTIFKFSIQKLQHIIVQTMQFTNLIILNIKQDILLAFCNNILIARDW